MKIQNGKNRILFSGGKLYLNDIQIAGEGIVPSKDVVFEFQVNKPEEPVNIPLVVENHPSVLEVNVHEAMAIQGVGPGQK